MIQQIAHTVLLLAVTAPVNGPSFDDASRDYRIETYVTFRQQRPEFDRRQQIGLEASRRWREAKYDKQLRNELVGWFVEAKDTTADGVELPKLPGEPSRASQREAAARRSGSRTNAVSYETNISNPAVNSVTRNTSIVTSEPIVDTRSDSETVRILNSVGRAVTRAFLFRRATDDSTPSNQSRQSDQVKNGSAKKSAAGNSSAQR